VHGGLRYLQNFDLGLVREALLERQINVRLAPHLVRPLPLVVPAFDGQRLDRIVGIGLNAYDVMAVDRLRRSPLRRRLAREDADWSPARHRTIEGDEVVELIPALAARAPTSGYLFYDCQTDDVRLVLTVLSEAERFGAVAANRVEALELLPGSAGARARDLESGSEFEIRAANVVNATGVWADRLRPSELHDEAEVPVIRPSRGTHLIVDSSVLPMKAGAIVPAGGGRSIFVLPWLGQTLVGTTDNDYEGELEHIRPPTRTSTTCSTRSTSSSRLAAAGGHRRRLRGRAAADLDRRPAQVGRHLAQGELYETSSGMVTITGGKLTTWRRMAEARRSTGSSSATGRSCRAARTRSRSGWRSRPTTCRAWTACPRTRTPSLRAATAMSRTTCLRWPASSPGPCSTACPT
jgi:glycerol-3-phosphate dehydrogenase